MCPIHHALGHTSKTTRKRYIHYQMECSTEKPSCLHFWIWKQWWESTCKATRPKPALETEQDSEKWTDRCLLKVRQATSNAMPSGSIFFAGLNLSMITIHFHKKVLLVS